MIIITFINGNNMIIWTMSKERNDSTVQKIAKLLVWLLVMTAAALFIWKLYGKVDIKKADFSKISIKKEEKSIYDMYQVESQKLNRNLYYVTISDIFCDAYRRSEFDNPHFFKIDIVFEAHSKQDAEAITILTKETVEEIRRMVKDYPVVGIDRALLMAYIKRDLKAKINNVLSDNVVVEVYFKSFLGQ